MGASLVREAVIPEARFFYDMAYEAISEDLWNAFIASSSTFAVERKTWESIAAKLCPNEFSSDHEPVIRERAGKLFRAFDPDGNGQVDAGELFVALLLMTDGSATERADFVFRVMDYDCNDVITVDEVLVTMKSLLIGSLRVRGESVVPTDDMVLRIAEHYFDIAVLHSRQVQSRGAQTRPGAAQAAGTDTEADTAPDVACAPHEDETASLTKAEFMAFVTQAYVDVVPDAVLRRLRGPRAGDAGRLLHADLLLGASLRDMLAIGLDIDSDIEAELGRAGASAVLPFGEGSGAHGASRAAPRQDDEDEEDLFSGGPAEGDEFMAVKPWLGAIKSPTNPPPVDASAPDVTLELEWVHGYRAQDCRNNLRFTADGFVAYHTAALGVLYDPDRHAQTFSRGHDDDIIGFSMSPDKRLVATGQVGKHPRICVWRAEGSSRGELLSTIDGFHKRGVPLLAFSPDGTMLASVGMDDNHSVAVYAVGNEAESWASDTPRAIFRVKGDAAKPLAVAWTPDGGFAVCGVKSIRFYLPDRKRTFRDKKGIFGRKVPIQTLLTAVAVGGTGVLATGTLSGDIYLWQGRNCVGRVPKAHAGAIAAMGTTEDGLLLSGGKDGSVKLWTEESLSGGGKSRGEVIVDLTSPDFQTLDLMSAQVRSVSASRDMLLVGTKGSEIMALPLKRPSANTARVFMRGHCADELWGLAAHPSGHGYVTTGDDKTLRMWNADDRRLTRMVRLPGMARAVDFSPDGRTVAVGLGGRVGRGRQKADGGVVIMPATLDSSSTADAFHARDAKQWISDVKFSPRGDVVAVGSHDNQVYLYNVRQRRLLRRCRGHSSYITHIDFSSDGQHMQTNCGAYELLFWETASGQQVTSASSLRNTKWHTWTCTLGWPVQGIWPSGSDGTDVNAVSRVVDRRHPSLLATVDDFGKLRIFRYPCTEDKAAFVEGTGHSSHVMNVCWLPTLETDRSGDVVRRVITVGGNDRSVFQWRVVVDVEASRETAHEAKMNETPVGVGGVDPRVAGLHGESRGWNENSIDMGLDDPFAGGGGGGDEFMAVKPWIGVVKNTVPSWNEHLPPAKLTRRPPRSTEDSCRLEFVHGYQAFTARSNVRYVGDDSRRIAYHAAALGIVLDPSRKAGQRPHQLFNRGHDDDIVCMAVSPDGKTAATGQLGRTPSIVLWDLLTGETRATMMGFHKRAVTNLAFSPDGSLLASVGLDDNHSVAIYDVQKGTLRARSKGDRGKVLDLCFGADEREFLQVGVKHARMWTLSRGSVKSKKVLFGKQGPPRAAVSSVYWPDERCYAIGTADGTILRVSGRKAGKAVRTHSGAVNTLYVVPGIGLLSGGADGVIVLTPSRGSPSPVLELATLSESALARHPLTKQLTQATFPTLQLMNTEIRSLATDSSNSHLLIGTRGSEILEAALHGDAIDREVIPSVLMRGHYADELWGLAMHPSGRYVCSAGDDKSVRMWDIEARGLVWEAKLPCMARAAAFSPDGGLLALGMGGRVGRGRQKLDGKVVVLATRKDGGRQNGKALQIEAEFHDSKQWISVVRFSPDGQWLAVGSHDNRVYLYDIVKLRLRHTLVAHSSYITHLDFSESSAKLQSTCGAYELLFWDIRSGAQVTSASGLKDEGWASWTCTLGWPVQGIWAPETDGTDVNAVARLSARDWKRERLFQDLLASGATREQWEDAVARFAQETSRLSVEDRASSETGLLATVDDFGKVNILRYPSFVEKATPARLSGHSSHVMNVAWGVTPRGGDGPRLRLFSVGGNDRCLCQWAFDQVPSVLQHGEEEGEGRGVDSAPLSGDEGDDDAVSGRSRSVLTGKSKSHRSVGEAKWGEVGMSGVEGGDEDSDNDAEQHLGRGQGRSADDDDDDLFADGPLEGDEFLAVKPWKGTVEHMVPSKHDRLDSSAPSTEISVEWVYGYQAQDVVGVPATNNVRYNISREIVYTTASFGIIYEPARSTTSHRDVRRHRQAYHLGHTNDITAFAMSADGKMAATGQQRDPRPRSSPVVRVWDADTGATMVPLSGFHKRCIVALAFSPDGTHLATVGDDDNHSVAIYTSTSGTWTDAQLGPTARGDRARTFWACWASDSEFYTGGVKHARSWKRESGAIRSKTVSFSGVSVRATTCACPDSDGGIVIGAAAVVGKKRTGALFQVHGSSASIVQGAEHGSAVYALSHATGDRYNVVLSGGADGTVKMWAPRGGSLSLLASINLIATASALLSASGTGSDIGPGLLSERNADQWSGIRSVCLDQTGDRLLVGTSGSEIYELDLLGRGMSDIVGAPGMKDAEVVESMVAMVEGHASGELWGCATHPQNQDIVATVGDEGLLRLWDINMHDSSLAVNIGCKGRCVAFSPCGLWLAVGAFGDTTVGGEKKRSARLLIFEVGYAEDGVSVRTLEPRGATVVASETITSRMEKEDRRQRRKVAGLSVGESNFWVSDVRFSPQPINGIQYIAVACHYRKRRLCVFRLTPGQSPARLARPISAISAHANSSAILHVDWSSDGRTLQTDDRSYELLFWEFVDGEKKLRQNKSPSSLKDTEFASFSCVLGWPVQGIWPSGADGTDINAVDRAPSGKILATGDDFGLVKLFRYPCAKEGAAFVAGSGHSSHVTNVRFSCNSRVVVSTGGNDRALVQWKLRR